MEHNFLAELLQLLELQYEIKDLHPLFNSNYPVTIVSNNTFHIYDVKPGKPEYQFVKEEPCTYTLPSSIRAAFPLDCYDKTTAVITEDAFETQTGFVDILHEFVHCAQSNIGDLELRDQLGIAQEYKQKNDFMWEINHPFPYSNPDFMELFSQYLKSLQHCDYSTVLQSRRTFNEILKSSDLEYLLWQEWKEGYARYIENKIRNMLGIAENHWGSEKPYNRISFYESGNLLCSLMEKAEVRDTDNMKNVFIEMKRQLF